MATFDNTYSRFVAWMKVILPLFALGILSTLFLVSRSIDATGNSPLLTVNVQDMAKEQKIGAPRYAGITDDGVAYTIIADSARPKFGENKGLSAVNITADIKTPDGLGYIVTAPAGNIDQNNDTAKLQDGVVIDTSDGMRIETDVLNSDTGFNLISSDDHISVEGPFGDFEAGKMVMTQQFQDGSPVGYLFEFTGGVDLLYIPEQE